MRRATITLTDELESKLERFFADREPRPSLAAVVQTALAKYLDNEEWQARSFEPAERPLRVTIARRGSGKETTSLEHDAIIGSE